MATHVDTDEGIDRPGLSKYVSTNSTPGYHEIKIIIFQLIKPILI